MLPRPTLYQYLALASQPALQIFSTHIPPPTWRAHPDPIPKRSVDYHCLAKVEHNLAHGKLKDATELARVSVSAVNNYSKAPAPGIEEDEYTGAI